jgi:hypothetical protein
VLPRVRAAHRLFAHLPSVKRHTSAASSQVQKFWQTVGFLKYTLFCGPDFPIIACFPDFFILLCYGRVLPPAEWVELIAVECSFLSCSAFEVDTRKFIIQRSFSRTQKTVARSRGTFQFTPLSNAIITHSNLFDSPRLFVQLTLVFRTSFWVPNWHDEPLWCLSFSCLVGGNEFAGVAFLSNEFRGHSFLSPSCGQRKGSSPPLRPFLPPSGSTHRTVASVFRWREYVRLSVHNCTGVFHFGRLLCEP